jgi:hypothetical protein
MWCELRYGFRNIAVATYGTPQFADVLQPALVSCIRRQGNFAYA